MVKSRSEWDGQLVVHFWFRRMIPNEQEIIKMIDDQFKDGWGFMMGAELKALKKSIIIPTKKIKRCRIGI